MFPLDIGSLICQYLIIPYRRGDFLEARDPFNKWYLITVIDDIAPNQILIHYQGIMVMKVSFHDRLLLYDIFECHDT